MENFNAVIQTIKISNTTTHHKHQNANILMPIIDHPRSGVDIGRVSYLIYVSMRHYVLTTSGDIVVCFHTAVYFSC